MAGCADTKPSDDSSAESRNYQGNSVVEALSADLQPAYENLNQPVDASMYSDFKAKNPPPWTIGYSSEYAGNSWRSTALDEITGNLLDTYKKANLVDDVIVMQSNLDDTVQAQQIRQMVDQGADAIITCCPSTTPLNQAIEYAYNKGVPTFVYAGFVDSPYAVNVSANYRAGGAAIAKDLFDKIGGKGNVLNVVGVKGTSASDSYDAGVQDALKAYPDIKLVGTVQGNWTGSVATTEVQKFLATHPEQIDGIIAQTPSETGVLQALRQSGRPIVPITLGGETGAACYWRNHPDLANSGFYVWPPGAEIHATFDVMMRTLEGQGPKIQSIVREIEPFDLAAVQAALPEDCDVSASDWIQPTMQAWSEGYNTDEFFNHPADPLAYKP
jgi:ribose transport system substrate-binding protein